MTISHVCQQTDIYCTSNCAELWSMGIAKNIVTHLCKWKWWALAELGITVRHSMGNYHSLISCVFWFVAEWSAIELGESADGRQWRVRYELCMWWIPRIRGLCGCVEGCPYARSVDLDTCRFHLESRNFAECVSYKLTDTVIPWQLCSVCKGLLGNAFPLYHCKTRQRHSLGATTGGAFFTQWLQLHFH